MGTCLLPVQPGYPKEVETDSPVILGTAWMPEQKDQVDGWVQQMADHVAASINELAPGIKALVKQQKPDCPYVAQGMLEDLIHELQKRV